MQGLGMGHIIDDLRLKIDQLKKEIDSTDKPEIQSPELIVSANLVRANEYLNEVNDKRSSLLDIYSRYTRLLEEVTKTLLDIQVDLKEIIHDQSKLIEEYNKQPKTKRAKKA